MEQRKTCYSSGTFLLVTFGKTLCSEKNMWIFSAQQKKPTKLYIFNNTFGINTISVSQKFSSSPHQSSPPILKANVCLSLFFLSFPSSLSLSPSLHPFFFPYFRIVYLTSFQNLILMDVLHFYLSCVFFLLAQGPRDTSHCHHCQRCLTFYE